MLKTTSNDAVIAQRFADMVLDIHPNECLVQFEIPDLEPAAVIREFEGRGYAVSCSNHHAIARRQYRPRHRSRTETGNGTALGG
ncbi:MAG: hypothetical protein WAO58_08695 [Fimbriimonadaceae bacterium]